MTAEGVDERVTSLAYNHQSVSHTNPEKSGDEPGIVPDQRGCPNMRGWAFVSTSTGQMVPARCGRNRCEWCVRLNAMRRAGAITYARPQRSLLLTQVGDEWQAVRARMKNLRSYIAAAGYQVEWVWHVEPNPLKTGHHVHAWQRGSYVPQQLLSKLAQRAGMGGFARVNRIRSVQRAAGYGLKGLTYGLKGVLAEQESEVYLRSNGWRLTHQSRRFFVSPEGEKLGVRGAEGAAAALLTLGGDEGPWELVRVESGAL